MALAFSILICCAAAAAVALPLFQRRVEPYLAAGPRGGEFDEMDAVLAAISELREDHQMGRVTNEDFERLTEHFERRYLELKRRR